MSTAMMGWGSLIAQGAANTVTAIGSIPLTKKSNAIAQAQANIAKYQAQIYGYKAEAAKAKSEVSLVQAETSRSKIQVANAQANLARANAQLMERKYQQTRWAGERAIVQKTAEAGRVKASQRASLAANGIAIGEGSAAELQASTDIIKEIDVNQMSLNALEQAWGYRFQAGNYELQAVGFEGQALNYEAEAVAYEGQSVDYLGQAVAYQGQVANANISSYYALANKSNKWDNFGVSLLGGASQVANQYMQMSAYGVFDTNKSKNLSTNIGSGWNMPDIATSYKSTVINGYK